MSGLSRHTASALSERSHLRQSIVDILTTPIGTRVMRRNYGSRLPDLIDLPMNEALKVDIYSATAEALLRWEPRFVLSQIAVSFAESGRLAVDLLGRDLLGNGIQIDEIVL